MLIAFPVLPLLASTMVSPGRSSPSRSARSIMYLAIRALMDPEGLRYSSLAHIPSTMTRGVLPIASRIVPPPCRSKPAAGSRAAPAAKPATGSRASCASCAAEREPLMAFMTAPYVHAVGHNPACPSGVTQSNTTGQESSRSQPSSNKAQRTEAVAAMYRGRRRGAGFTSHHGLGRVCPRSMTGVEAGDQDSGLRLAELVAAFSLATDLGMGQPMEHVLRSWLIAGRLGERLDLQAEARVSLYYVMVLAWAGCVADTAEVAAPLGDDIAYRGHR